MAYEPFPPDRRDPFVRPRPRPRPRAPVDPLVTQATASVDAGVNATLAAIRAEQERAEKAARGRAEQIGQFTAALAETLKGIGPQIQAGYQTAANTQATFGKGYSDAMKAIQSGNATDTNSFLQNVVGAPAGQQIPGEKATAAADVLYGLGGKIPAGLFAAQGAGYGEAAAAYPLQAGQQGQFLAAQELAKGAEERARYQALIDEQIGRRPGLIQAAVDKLRKEKSAAAKERYSQALDLYNADLLTQRGLAQALGLPDWKKYPQVTKSQAKPSDLVFREAGGYVLAIDPKTGDLVRTYGSGRAPTKDRIVQYQDARGRQHVLNLDTREDTLLPGPAEAPYTKKELDALRVKANIGAERTFYGVWDDGKPAEGNNPAVPGKWIVEPMSYQEALTALMRRGSIPLLIAQKALNFYWKKPGYDREVVLDWKTGKRTIKWFRDKSGGGRPMKSYQEKQGTGPRRYSKSAGGGSGDIPPFANSTVGRMIWGGAVQRGLDPLAVLAVVSGEGGAKWGAVGDGGHAFGPFQLNNAGGVVSNMSATAAAAFANSPKGIDFALDKIAEVAQGLTGEDAVNAIVRRFERPANPDRSVTNALAVYQQNKISARGADSSEWVRVPAPRGSSSQPHQMRILSIIGQLAQVYGKPLEVWDNTTHSKYTVNGNVSAHYSGNAADIPASGDKLRELGYLALRMAGVPEAEARKAQRSGGLFNVGGFQIIFATRTGGNHYDHLHIGLRSDPQGEI